MNMDVVHKQKAQIFLLILLQIAIVPLAKCAFPNFYPKLESKPVADDCNAGEPLILTPFIETNRIKEAIIASETHFNGFKGIQSHSGYLTVDKVHNSNLFFWFFPSQSEFKTDPLILWLQGGPGASSLFGLFTENGPYIPKKRGLKLREYTWTKAHSVLYIDQPIGTGFSFVGDNTTFCTDEAQVGQHLYTALQQFFTLFKVVRNNDFFISGESYGGKYVPSIAHTILTENKAGRQPHINLKGITIGNGLTDPINQLAYSNYFQQLSLIDANGRKLFEQYQQKAINYIKTKDYQRAFQIFDQLLNGDTINRNSIFRNLTGYTNYFNYLYPSDPFDTMSQLMNKYVQRCDIRAAIHVGNKTFNSGTNVENHLQVDIMKSIAYFMPDLLANYRVLIYNGQLDVIVPYPLTVNYLQTLNFNGQNEYKMAKRKMWYVGDELAGYAKTAGNLTEVLVRNAGHMVPADQPKWAYDLITRFIRNKPF